MAPAPSPGIVRGAAWLSVLALLALAAVALSWFPLAEIASPVALSYNEGWNAYRQQMAATGIPLYASPPLLTSTNYPFLSFHIVGALSHVFGDVNVIGRAVAFAAMVVTCLLIAGTVRALAGSRRAAAYAALCFFVWVAFYTPDRIATNEPQLLGTVFSALGLHAYARARGRIGWIVLSALAFAIGVFTKNNLIAFPIAVALHLLLQRQWRDLACWAGIGAVAAILLLVLTYGLDGPFFAAHLLRGRLIVPRVGALLTFDFLAHFSPALVLALAFLAWSERSGTRLLLRLVFAVAFGLGLIFIIGDGTGGNVFQDAVIAIALAVALALAALETLLPRQRWGHALFAALLLFPVLPAFFGVPGELYDMLADHQRRPAIEADAAKGIALIRSTPGPALCEDLLLCFAAGKEMTYDSYYVHDQVQAGLQSEDAVLALIESRYFGAIQIGAFGNLIPISTAPRLRFSGAFMSALVSHYKLALQTRRFAVFVPR